MKKYFTLILVILSCDLSTAQFVKEKAINAQIGYGLSAPYYSRGEIVDDGFFAQGELVLAAASWIEFRPYAGVIWTSSNGKDINNNPTDEKAESKAFLVGGKARVRAPIPWVAPYAEIGIGASAGSFRTLTYFTDIRKSGIAYHIPFSFGLELGRNHDVDLGFAYYFQPSVEQYAGAFALGFTIPLENN